MQPTVTVSSSGLYRHIVFNEAAEKKLFILNNENHFFVDVIYKDIITLRRVEGAFVKGGEVPYLFKGEVSIYVELSKYLKSSMGKPRNNVPMTVYTDSLPIPQMMVLSPEGCPKDLLRAALTGFLEVPATAKPLFVSDPSLKPLPRPKVVNKLDVKMTYVADDSTYDYDYMLTKEFQDGLKEYLKAIDISVIVEKYKNTKGYTLKKNKFYQRG